MVVDVGVDVAKADFEALFLESDAPKKPPHKALGNDPSGYESLVNWVDSLANGREVRYCMESTGGYELGLACYLASTGRYVSVENPRRIKRFADAMGQANKTDRSDARVIAAYARAMRPRAWVLSDGDRRMGLQLTRYREDLLTELRRVRNRLEHSQALEPLISEHLQDQERFLAAKIETVNEQIDELLERCKTLADEVGVLTGFEGVATLTAITLISEMPDARDFDSAEQWAAQAGMFPARRESGRWKGQTRMCKAGNAHVRRILYMGATKSMRMNPVMKAFAERLRIKGKKPKQIRVACMRKLLLMCFGALRAFYGGKPIFYGLPPART